MPRNSPGSNRGLQTTSVICITEAEIRDLCLSITMEHFSFENISAGVRIFMWTIKDSSRIVALSGPRGVNKQWL